MRWTFSPPFKLANDKSTIIIETDEEEKILKVAYAYEKEAKFRERYKPTFKGGVQ